MADESHAVRGINWRETFSFTQIFRAFRVAIHPTKLILGLVALLSIYLGGRVLDAIWPVSQRAVPGEVAGYEKFSADSDPARTSFDEAIQRQRERTQNDYARQLMELKVLEKEEDAKNAAKSASKLGDVKAALIKKRDDAINKMRKETDDAKNGKNEEEKRKLEAGYRTQVATLLADNYKEYQRAKDIKGEGVFISFFDYEKNQVNNAAWAVLGNNWLGGFGNNPAVGGKVGVVKSLSNFAVAGPWWLIRYHTTYFILFAILVSIVWAIFGGAISRIAAVHVARDEKISLSGALRFSTGKFLSFIFAPIIPLVIVLVVGGVVALGGLLANIPVLGPILVGLLFFLAIAAGFVMTLVLLGTGGGFNLMYPTIAVEGSDSFDAISRSFSYVYARPWRMLFYTLIAIVYGALCFLFVRFFVGIVLILTHYFVGAGMFVNVDGNRIPLDLWNTMWPSPAGHGFTYDVDWMTLSGGQATGAFLVSLWVYLTAGMVGAFLISFYFSANTIIYFLMRREVDATELDDVYLEQSEEDFGDTAPPVTKAPDAGAPGSGTGTGTGTGTTTVVTPTTPPTA
jgi:hypothetical protein